MYDYLPEFLLTRGARTRSTMCIHKSRMCTAVYSYRSSSLSLTDGSFPSLGFVLAKGRDVVRTIISAISMA